MAMPAGEALWKTIVLETTVTRDAAGDLTGSRATERDA